MGISTKTGDSGLTSLRFRGRVKKYDLRIEACGVLDELSSFLGLSKSLLKDKLAKKLIDGVQQDLFIIGSEIATGKSYVNKLEKRIRQEDVRNLELIIARLEKKYRVTIFSFVLPGENTLSAVLDISRTFARRAERRIVTLVNTRMIKNRQIQVYLNRLSDLLYLLARSYEKKRGRINYI